MKKFLFFFLLYTILPHNSLHSQTIEKPDSLTEPEIEWLTGPINTETSDSPLLEYFERNFFLKQHQELAINIRSRFAGDLEERKAYSDGTYLGTSLKSYQRIRAAQKDFSGGILIKKDAGEENFNDFTTGFIQAKNAFDSVSLTLGDYTIEHGQGLSLWQGFDLEKGSDVTRPAHRIAHGVVPHLTSDEAHYFSGVAAEFHQSQLTASLFYSHRDLAATTNPFTSYVSLYNEGYFRTNTELAKRNTLGELTIGGAGTYGFNEHITAGASFYGLRYSSTILSRNKQPFLLNEVALGSVSFEAEMTSAKLFGEFAGDGTGALGAVLGTEIFPSGDIRLIIALRRYDEEFYSPHGLGFGEQTGTNNEQGVYSGITYELEKDKKLSGYVDLFSFPSPSSTNATQGNDELLRYQVQSTDQLSLALQAKRKQTMYNLLTVSKVDSENTSYQFRINSNLQWENGLSLCNRFEYTALSHPLLPDETGFLFYTDVGIKVTEHFSGNTRVVYFHTDSFNSGVAEFERDVDGLLNIPLLFGEGVRWYVYFDYTVLNNLKVQAKFSTLYRSDVTFIGTGVNQFSTNAVNTVSLQVEWER